MRINENFVIREMAGTTILLPVSGEFQGVMAVSPVGGRILELIREGVEEEERLYQILIQEYDAPAEEIRRDGKEFLEKLRENQILLEN